MGDDRIKRAAQEYLAERLSADGLTYEQQLNREAAIACAPALWQKLIASVTAMCDEWNAETRENTFSCKETILGDLRVRCAGRPHHLIFHFESKQRLVRLENTARQEHEPKTVLNIEGYLTESGRQARFMRNNEPVDLHTLLLRQFRILAGLRGRGES
ncbi:MAG TPA: hypothetical protein VMH20_00870 [Verrucomicrobiae bacterium]|nr:hypothetical protein [Verrucomicrobiae bacterium]